MTWIKKRMGVPTILFASGIKINALKNVKLRRKRTA